MTGYYNGSNTPTDPTGPGNRKTGEQYPWASFLPYTVGFRGDQWCTWTIIALWSAVAYGAVDAASAVILSLDNMGTVILVIFLVSAVVCVSASLATFQLHKARGEARAAGLDPRTAVPRGWAISIALTAMGALSVLTWGGAVLAMMG